MARGQNASTGRVARSEGFSFQGPSGQAGATFMKSQINLLGTIDDVEKRNTAVAISNALNDIADDLLPTKPTTLAELSEKKEREYDRLMSVKADERVSKGIGNQLDLLAGETDKDKRVKRAKDGASYVQEGLGRGRRAVVDLANELMMQAFVDGRRNFALFAENSISQYTPIFGEKTAAKVVNLAIREGFERMKRAGMIWQEEDPRFT